MIIRERVLESKLATKINGNMDLAKEFGLEISLEKDYPTNKNLDNRMNAQATISSTEA